MPTTAMRISLVIFWSPCFKMKRSTFYFICIKVLVITNASVDFDGTEMEASVKQTSKYIHFVADQLQNSCSWTLCVPGACECRLT